MVFFGACTKTKNRKVLKRGHALAKKKKSNKTSEKDGFFDNFSWLC